MTAIDLRPCWFRFDYGPIWDGFAHGSTWNGFDNVAVTRETLEKLPGGLGGATRSTVRPAELPSVCFRRKKRTRNAQPEHFY